MYNAQDPNAFFVKSALMDLFVSLSFIICPGKFWKQKTQYFIKFRGWRVLGTKQKLHKQIKLSSYVSMYL